MQFVSTESVSSDKNSWIVIGAGPCGIASVGRLFDLGLRVTWIDPSFGIGRMGQFYREVPANTLNGDLLVALRMCKSFNFDSNQSIRRENGRVAMADLEADKCFRLGEFVECLEDCTMEMKSLVSVVYGKVNRLCRSNNGKWEVHVAHSCPEIGLKEHAEDIIYQSDAVILMCGSKPTLIPSLTRKGEGIYPFFALGTAVHSLDKMVCPVYVRSLLQNQPLLREQKWAVIGNSHSGMLVVKNLVEAGVLGKVTSYHRSPLKFMYVTSKGCKKYQGIGLKGPVGEWVTSQIASSDPAFTQVQVSNDINWINQLIKDGIQQSIVAIGFARNVELSIEVNGQQLLDCDFDAYDRLTGEIKSTVTNESIGLFGGGIAFAQDLIDDEGDVEPWVGFKRSIEQTDLMVEAFYANNERACVCDVVIT